MKPIMNILSLSLLAAAALLVSCTQDEWSGGVALPAGNALHVSSAVIATGSGTEMEISTRTKSATRADASNTLVSVASGSLGIFRSQGTNYTSTLDNKKYTYINDTKGWQPATSSDTIYLNGDDADVCAYYPYNSDMFYNDKTGIPLTSGKYAGFGINDPNQSFFPTDLCYATNRTLNGSQRATTFELKHAMAMLEFKISKEADYKGDCRITSVSIQNPELIKSSSIDITDGTYAAPDSNKVVKDSVVYTPGTDDTGILIESTTVTTAAMLVPFKPTSAGLTITFVTNGVNVEANIPATKIANVEAGKRYTVSITMKAASMQVTGVDMVPWDEIGVGGDDFTWYPTEDVIKLTSPIHIASYDWAWFNLDYVNGQIALRDFQTWPKPPYGVHWPYCVMVPNTNTDNTNAIAGSSTYSYDTDPCSALNTLVTDKSRTWTLPTKHQIALLMATDHVNKQEGCWFGTSTPPAKDDGTYLFLPANSELYAVGVPISNIGAYWLSDGGPYTLFCVGTHSAGYPTIEDKGAGTNYNAMVRCVEKARETITIDGVEWAMGNLVLKNDGTYVIDSYQGAIPPHMEDGSDWSTCVTAGYHFTWNSLTRKTMADNAAYEYDIANDPCAQVAPKGTWRTPTKEEFQKAIDQGSYKGTYTINDVTVDGYYLGTDSQPAKGDGDRYLFLPQAGEGDQSSFYKSVTAYWTSTETTTGGNNAYQFMDGSVGSFFNKSHGSAIRCVKK